MPEWKSVTKELYFVVPSKVIVVRRLPFSSESLQVPEGILVSRSVADSP